MKRLTDLTTEDLDANQLWRFDGDTDDEMIVTPVSVESVVENAPIIAKTNFTLADGTQLTGYSSPTDDRIDYVQPVIIAKGCHIRLYYDRREEFNAADAPETVLAKTPDEIYPIRYTSVIAAPDVSPSGIVDRLVFGDE